MVAVAKRPRRSTGFGDRLRALREAAGLTQTSLGDRIGITYQNIAKYERGAMVPTWPVVVTLAEALGVTPDAFLDGPDDDGDQGPDDDEPPTVRRGGKKK